jgi:hypothetical protein
MMNASLPGILVKILVLGQYFAKRSMQPAANGRPRNVSLSAVLMAAAKHRLGTMRSAPLRPSTAPIRKAD